MSRVVPMGEQRTTDHGGFRDTVRALAAAQKGKASGAPLYSVTVNRPVGRVLAAVCFRAGLTPNQVTGISAVCSALGVTLLLVLGPSWGTGIAVWFLLALGYAFDSADGQVARLRGGGSPAGEWLDHVVDCVKINAVHLGVFAGAWLHQDTWPWWSAAVPLLFLAVGNTSFFTMILNDSLKQLHGVALRVPGQYNWKRSALALPTDYGVLCLSFVLLGALPWFMGFYTLLFLGSVGHLCLALVKWYRDMASLPRKTASS